MTPNVPTANPSTSTRRRRLLLATAMVGVTLCGAAMTTTPSDARASIAASTSDATPAGASETMVDRCSGSVMIPPAYNSKFNPNRPPSGTIAVPDRKSNGWGDWSKTFTVKTSDAGHIRWYCHSQAQFPFLDPGTWVFSKDQKICIPSGPCIPIPEGFTDVAGWYPERSRCSDRSNRIRARLGPDRALQIQCM